MTKAIILDSTPLALLAYRRGFPPAEECRAWVRNHLAASTKVYVPAIVAYELRRELLRLQNHQSLMRLKEFIEDVPGRYLKLTDPQLDQAAELWAELRQRGRPTAAPDALDIDVILAAQALSLGLPRTDFIVASSNISHLSQLVPANEWQQI